MTPTAARWIEASRDLTEARIAHQSAAQHERAAWAALQREVDGRGLERDERNGGRDEGAH